MWMSVTLDLCAVRSVRTLSEVTRAAVETATNWLLMAELALVKLFLPSATVVAERYCFYTFLWFCSRRGVCMAKGECAWQGTCIPGGGVHGREGVHGWGGMHGKGACVAGVWQGEHVWQGASMGERCHGGHAWQLRHAWHGGMHGRKDSHCSGQYASYWNAFLSNYVFWNLIQRILRNIKSFSVTATALL